MKRLAVRVRRFFFEIFLMVDERELGEDEQDLMLAQNDNLTERGVLRYNNLCAFEAK